MCHISIRQTIQSNRHLAIYLASRQISISSHYPQNMSTHPQQQSYQRQMKTSQPQHLKRDDSLGIRNQPSSTNEQQPQDNTYNNFSEYIFSLIGYCVGFGTFWRFPYLVYKNGGGAFLIPYIFSLVVISIPMNYLEVAIGQLGRLSQPMFYERINKGLKLLGLTYLLVNFTMLSYLNVLLVYSYRFILLVIFQSTDQLAFKDQTLQDNTYFHQTVLNKSSSIEHFGQLNILHTLIYVASVFAVYLVIKNGVKTSGKITIVTAILPYVIFLILIIRGLMLPGALQGLKVLFVPDFSKLTNFQIWSDGFNQAFFGMGISQATTVAFSSMKSKKQKVIAGVYLLPIALVICGFMCASIVYIYIGNYCMQNGIEISTLQLQGPQLSFSIFPKVLIQIPIPKLWLLVFFVAMVFLGIDSQFGILESIFAYINNYFDCKREIKLCSVTWLTINASKAKILVVLLVSTMSIVYCSSAGIFYLAYFDNFGTLVPFAISALFEVVIFVYVLPFSQTQHRIEQASGQKMPTWIKKVLLSPLLVGIVAGNLLFCLVHQILQYGQYPLGFYIFGWIYSLGPYLAALVYFLKVNQTDVWRIEYQELENRQKQLFRENIESKRKDQEYANNQYIVLSDQVSSSF